MAINAPSRVETPKVGTGPLNGANTATLIGPCLPQGLPGRRGLAGSQQNRASHKTQYQNTLRHLLILLSDHFVFEMWL
jgi:hypothetical protein